MPIIPVTKEAKVDCEFEASLGKVIETLSQKTKQEQKD
jgi:hypothetical protein